MYITEDYFHKNKVCLARLNNGKIMAYDMCDDSKDAYSDVPDKEYLGIGTIYDIGGVRQRDPEVLHFWVFK